MLAIFVNQLVFPTYALALTGGPTQPEVHGFEPVGTNQMVDLFSGDFTYNIPLFDIGGYPMNLAYHSGTGMEQEASWVGLGWSLTPGAINRNLRGLPDDFDGEEVKFMRKMKANQTIGINLKLEPEVLGFEVGDKLKKTVGNRMQTSIGIGLMYNTYTSWDVDGMASLSAKPGPDQKRGSIDPRIDFSSDGGLSVGANPNLSAIAGIEEKKGESGRSSLSDVLNSFVPGDGEMSWSSNNGLSMSFSGQYFFNKKGTYSAGYSGNIIMNEKVYSPGSDVSMWNFGAKYTTGLGSQALILDGQMHGDFWYNVQRLGGYRKKGGPVEDGVANWNLKAYGVEHAANASETMEDDLLDYNREHEYALRAETPLLPVGQLTYDVFSISGQGTGGSFRNYRNDFPVVGKNLVRDVPSTDLYYGLDFSSGNTVKVGGSASLSFSSSKNGFWQRGNDEITDNMGFVKPNSNHWLFEPSYFKKGGEFGLVDQEYLNEIGGEKAASFELERADKLDNELFRQGTSVAEVNNSDYQTNRAFERVKRGSAILSLNKKDASNYGFVMGLERDASHIDRGAQIVPNHIEHNHDYSSPLNGTGYSKIQKLDRFNDRPGKEHHYGEFQVTQDDGYTYVYGLPIYNHQTVEMSFAISEETQLVAPNSVQGMGYAKYNSKEASDENESGYDHFVSRKEIPEYAHSFLLTAILSPDYIDVLGDGVTDDDYGEAVIFNYEKVHDDFGWRNPVADEPDKARFIEGLRTDDQDDKASYVYGTKEVWVLQSIESQNMVAEFITSDREDSYGVSDESGTIDTETKQRKLDKIELYNKMDRVQEDASHKPVPIKTIYFYYGYDLCKGVPNHGNSDPEDGKLTLKKLAFSYGNSGAALLSPYEFDYNELNNFDYNPLNVDRWGNYMDYNSDHPNPDFPYTNQDKTQTDKFASAWLLSKITLPSDGEINIDYESDDYAYVMEKKAMAMQNIAGVGQTTDFTPSNKLYNSSLGADHNFIYFELPDATYTDDDVKSKFSPGQHLYFKCLFQIQDVGGPNSDDKEYVSGYAKVKDIGLCTAQDPNQPGKAFGYIQIEEKREGNIRYQAISAAAWNFLLTQMSDRISGLNPPQGNLQEVGKDILLSNLGRITQLIKGQMGRMKAEHFAQYIDLSKSIIRLQEPTGYKLGGGSRVKQITMSDNWDAMSAESESQYGSVYTYEQHEDPEDETSRMISSGVASYEPMVGNEENPYKEPIYFSYRPKSVLGLVKVGPRKEEKILGPYGEMFFPGAGVGYSNVKVTSLATARMNANEITGTPTGYTTHEFFTARDFPVIQDKTTPVLKHNNPFLSAAQKLLGITRSDMAMSQGYSFIINDMHGKPEKTTSYNQKGEPMSSKEFVYKVDPDEPNKLSNEVQVLQRDGSIITGQVGVEVDFLTDAHESINRSYETAAKPGVDAFSMGIPPFLALPNIWFSFTSSTNNLRFVSNTKVIHKYGILEKVIVTDLNSTVETENVLWDAESGQVLLTRTKNEYDDPLENFSLPAHFVHSGMSGAYENLGLQVYNIDITDGVYELPSVRVATDYFEPGDEVVLTKGGSHQRAWVLEVISTTSPSVDKIYLVDREGQEIEDGTYSKMKLLRSGKRNQSNLSVLSVTSNGDIVDQLTNKNINDVLQVGAFEFSDEWGTYCDRLVEQNCVVTDDLVKVLNCMWTEANGNFGKDVGVNLNSDCPGMELQSDLKRQALELSDMKIMTNEGESVTYNLYTVEFTGDGKFDVEDELGNLGAHLDKVVHNETGGVVTSVTYYIRSVNLLDFDQIKASVLANTSNTTDYVSPYSGPTADVVIENPYRKSNSYRIPYFKFMDENSTTRLTEIKIGVGATGSYEDNEAVNWEDIKPYEMGCEFTLKVKAPAIDVLRSEIASFTGLTYTASGEYIVHADLVGGGTIDFTLEDECLNLKWCEPAFACSPEIDDKVVNPYVLGMRGNWRPKNSFVYHTTRSSSIAQGPVLNTSHTDIRQDGELENFSLPIFNTAGQPPFTISGDRWISPNTVTVYAPGGSEVETQDALGRYSSEVYGYDRRVVIAAANNAPHHNIAFDGFEEYTFLWHQECRKDMHWALSEYVGFTQSVSPLSNQYKQDQIVDWKEVSDEEAHTGNYCIKLDAGDYIVTDDVVKNTCTPNTQTSLEPFKLSDCDCIGNFEPDGGQKYFFSAWIKEGHTVSPETYTQSRVIVSVLDQQMSQLNTVTLEPKGSIIEGWQRVEGSFEIPSGADLTLRVRFEADASLGAVKAYLDDVRMQPFNSQMKTYVYNHDDLRLSAELDENNYATFYEYDEEGRLIRVKKETERGIMTLQESRYGIANK
mgnify:CR=1 FL=1